MLKRVIAMTMALVVVVPVTTITAAPKSPKLAKCDGKQRRPANPYGSILPNVNPQTGTSTPTGQTSAQEPVREGVGVFSKEIAVPPKPAKPDDNIETLVPPISNLQLQHSYQSC